MTFEELTRLQHVLAQAEAIIQGSLAQKKTIQDLDLHKSLLKFRLKVQKRMAALKHPGKP